MCIRDRAISIQFIVGKQYASPEIPLAFFFTLTLYFFLKGHLSGNSINYRFAAVALGLTVLTKGYPYIIVIVSVMMLFLLIESGFQWRILLNKVKELKPISFMAIVAVIGLSWIALMYFRYGDNFLAVLNEETLERALAKESNGLRDLFFYPEVLLWSFFPYSPLFIYAFFHSLFNMKQLKEIAFGLSWFMAMLIIFTIAKGKIPTYFIQAHPALALISAHFISRYKPVGNAEKIIWKLLFILPAAAGIIISTAIIVVFHLPLFWHLITASALLLMVMGSLPKKDGTDKDSIPYLAPFIGTFCALLIFSIGVLPALEERRPMDSIGKVINLEQHIPKTIPLYLEDGLLHNLPFYAERKVIPGTIPAAVLRQRGAMLALIRSENVPDSIASKVIWKGEIYRRRSSESRLLLFIQSYLKAKEGDMSGFTGYSLIYKK